MRKKTSAVSLVIFLLVSLSLFAWDWWEYGSYYGWGVEPHHGTMPHNSPKGSLPSDCTFKPCFGKQRHNEAESKLPFDGSPSRHFDGSPSRTIPGMANAD